MGKKKYVKKGNQFDGKKGSLLLGDIYIIIFFVFIYMYRNSVFCFCVFYYAFLRVILYFILWFSGDLFYFSF